MQATHAEGQVEHKGMRVKVARIVAVVGEREHGVRLAPPRGRVEARGREEAGGRGRADLEGDAGVVAGPEPDAHRGAAGVPAADHDEEAAPSGVEGGAVGRGGAELDAAALVEVHTGVAVGRGDVPGAGRYLGETLAQGDGEGGGRRTLT